MAPFFLATPHIQRTNARKQGSFYNRVSRWTPTRLLHGETHEMSGDMHGIILAAVLRPVQHHLISKPTHCDSGVTVPRAPNTAAHISHAPIHQRRPELPARPCFDLPCETYSTTAILMRQGYP